MVDMPKWNDLFLIFNVSVEFQKFSKGNTSKVIQLSNWHVEGVWLPRPMKLILDKGLEQKTNLCFSSRICSVSLHYPYLKIYSTNIKILILSYMFLILTVFEFS